MFPAEVTVPAKGPTIDDALNVKTVSEAGSIGLLNVAVSVLVVPDSVVPAIGETAVTVGGTGLLAGDPLPLPPHPVVTAIIAAIKKVPQLRVRRFIYAPGQSRSGHFFRHCHYNDSPISLSTALREGGFNSHR